MNQNKQKTNKENVTPYRLTLTFCCKAVVSKKATCFLQYCGSLLALHLHPYTVCDRNKKYIQIINNKVSKLHSLLIT